MLLKGPTVKTPPTDTPFNPRLRFDDGKAYEQMMGRWSALVAGPFLDWLAMPPGLQWLDDADLDQPAKTLSEDVRRDSLLRLQQLTVVTSPREHQIAHDQEAPAVTNDFERQADRAEGTMCRGQGIHQTLQRLPQVTRIPWRISIRRIQRPASPTAGTRDSAQQCFAASRSASPCQVDRVREAESLSLVWPSQLMEARSVTEGEVVVLACARPIAAQAAMRAQLKASARLGRRVSVTAWR